MQFMQRVTVLLLHDVTFCGYSPWVAVLLQTMHLVQGDGNNHTCALNNPLTLPCSVIRFCHLDQTSTYFQRVRVFPNCQQ